MKKIIVNIMLIAWLLLVVFAFYPVSSFAGGLKSYAFPFIGKWQPAEDPLLIEDYGFQDIQNLRKDGKRLKGVSGHTKINTTPFFSDYDYTDFTETDASSRITVATNTLTIANLDSDEDAYVYLDKSAGWFNEDFTFQFDFNCTDITNSICGLWGLSNTVDGLFTLADSNLDHLALKHERYISSNTKLLLLCEGADGSTTFTDSSTGGHTITAHGNAQVDTAQSKDGNGSLIIAATADYISTPTTSDWNFGSNPFTIDAWIRFEDLPVNGQSCIINYSYEDVTHYLTFFATNSGGTYQLGFVSRNASDIISFTETWSSPTADTWYHIAAIRGWGGNANDFVLTVNGTPLDSASTYTTATPTFSSGNTTTYTTSSAAPSTFWVDDISVTKGEALWTSDFSSSLPPQCNLILQETNGASDTTDTSTVILNNTDYYLTIIRDESQGTYGKLYCYIYSDTNRMTLVDTLTVTLTEKQNFEYLFGVISYDGSTGNQAWSGTISNFNEGYTTPINGFHFIKDQPSETHIIIQSKNSEGDGILFQNTTAIPSQGNFSTTALYTEDSNGDVGRFSIAPQGDMIYCNGAESLIWGGNEKKTNSVFVCSDASNSNPQDYTKAIQNTLQTGGNYLTIGGGNDAYTVLLLHGEGTDGGTTFTDSSASAHTPSGADDTQTDTDQHKFGTSSILFDGDDDDLTIPDHANWYMGTGKFTVDFWARFSDLTTNTTQGFFRQWVDNDNYVRFYRENDNLYFEIVVGGSQTVLVGGDTRISFSENTWYHMAVIRGWTGGVNSWAVTLNGIQVGDTVTDTDEWPDLAAQLGIGKWSNTTEFAGWLDEFRITKAAARWKTAFVVPDRPYRSSSLYWVIGSTRPIQGIKYYVLNANGQNATITAKEWTGSAWSSLSVTDNTSVSGVSMAQTGTVTFSSTVNTSRPTVISGEYLFWYQCALSAGNVDIYYITLDAPIQNIIDIWDATPINSLQFQVYDGGKWEDYSEEVAVETTVDYETNPMAAELDDLTNTEYVYIAFPDRICGIKFNMTSHVNTNAATPTVYYWDGNSWVSVGSVTDDTSDSGKSMAKSGYIYWNPPEKGEEFPRNLFGLHSSWVTKKTTDISYRAGSPMTGSPRLLPVLFASVVAIPERVETTTSASHSSTTEVPPGYYYKIMWSATLSADVLVDTVSGIRAQEINAIPGYKFPLIFQGRSFLCSETSGEKNKCIYCMFDAPDIWNGSDTGNLYFGDDTELTAGAVLYNTYRSSSFDQIILTKRNETYRLVGDSPETWIINKLSPNIGCPAPLTMQTCEVGSFSGEDVRNIAIWQTDSGVVMCDGAAIIDISKDIACYWDPNDSRYIPTDRIDDSEATYDPNLGVYKLLISSGSGQTTHNIELEYSLKYNEWTKIYRENTSGANPLQCSFQVHDTGGKTYLYGSTNEGYVYRLENGTDWDGTDIAEYIQTKDILLDNNKPMFNKTIVEIYRLMFETKTTTGQDISITHYCDGTATTDGSNNQVVPDDIDMDDGPYETQDCMLGRCLSHSFKISANIDDVTDGMELTGMGLLYESFDIVED